MHGRAYVDGCTPCLLPEPRFGTSTDWVCQHLNVSLSLALHVRPDKRKKEKEEEAEDLELYDLDESEIIPTGEFETNNC